LHNFYIDDRFNNFSSRFTILNIFNLISLLEKIKISSMVLLQWHVLFIIGHLSILSTSQLMSH